MNWLNLGNLTELFAPALNLRAAATPLVATGIAAEIVRGETHIYEVPIDFRDLGVTLSVCNYNGTNWDTANLYLNINQTAFETSNGLASIGTFSSYSSNGTVTITTPAGDNHDTWSYQLGIGGSSSDVLSGPNLYLVDTDFANSLLVTSPLKSLSSLLMSAYEAANAQDTMAMLGNATMGTSNISLSVFPADSPIIYLSDSFCALQEHGLLNQNNADQSTTTRGKVPGLRSQFLVKGLNSTSEYIAFASVQAPQPHYLGGMVLGDFVPFATKTSTSCQVIYNMSFCSEMAFAVPGNASAFTAKELTYFYDQMAEERYQNFSNTLDQADCMVDQVNMFSPLKTCDDCATSYKNWLCTTSIPRCADLSNNASYLVTREPGESRNPLIDEVIQPGAYKEILPCAELCYSLVRDCPVSLGFGCPDGELLAQTYGQYSDEGDITCSYPGAVYDESGALWRYPSWILLGIAVALFI